MRSWNAKPLPFSVWPLNSTSSRQFLKATLLVISLWAKLSFSCSKRRLACWSRRFSFCKLHKKKFCWVSAAEERKSNYFRKKKTRTGVGSDQVFVHRVIVHDLKPTFPEFHFLCGDLGRRRRRRRRRKKRHSLLIWKTWHVWMKWRNPSLPKRDS